MTVGSPSTGSPSAPGAGPVPAPAGQAALRRRTLLLLTLGQILGGLGFGASLSVGALATARLAGPAWSGLAATTATLGAALAALPLARLADRAGRRPSLTTASLVAAAGAAICAGGLVLDSVVVLLLGMVLLGVATAAALQSRFAATDLATPASRGRDLSLVVWSTTIGAVIGPNLAGPGDRVGAVLGLPPLAGTFLFTVAAQALAAVVYWVWLRPDPLLVSRSEAAPLNLSAVGRTSIEGNPRLVRIAIVAIALSHGTMVALMSMTPVHLVSEGESLNVVGLTISLHIAGMFALSPVFGVLADRIGRFPTILGGQALLVAAALVTANQTHHTPGVMTGLVLLGLGWSASTVAGSALLSDAAPSATRVRWQGRSDLAMNLAGALGGALSGPVLATLAYAGLAVTLLAPITVIVLATGYGWRRWRVSAG